MLDKIGLRFAANYHETIIKQPENRKTFKPVLPQNSENVLLHLNYLSNINRARLLSFGSISEDEQISKNIKTLRNFELDKFQQRAVDAMTKENKDVILTAPTGVGKTAVAERVIQHNIQNDIKTIYTAPLKALTEQKVREFKELFGEENVGVHTGDRVDNVDAKVVLMTTEVYNNIVSSADTIAEAGRDQLKDVKTVIFDEFHYINDPDRGHVWEHSVMNTPKDIHMLAMSATIGHPERVKSWFEGLNETRNVELVEVPKEQRPVKLRTYVFTPGKPKTTIVSTDKKRHISIGKTEDSKNTAFCIPSSKANLSKVGTLQIDALIGLMHAASLPESDLTTTDKRLGGNKTMLPAIVFRFNKRDCNKMKELVKDYMQDRRIFKSGATVEDIEAGIEPFSLLTADEQKRLVKIVKEFKKDQKYLGQDFDETGLKKGVAIHHAGIMPHHKELVERLFSEKLLKVVFSTETLAAGINMPARSVILTQYKKQDDRAVLGRRDLSPSEINQIAGRAGRRGKDKVGHVIFLNDKDNQLDKALETFDKPADDIKSSYAPQYGLVLSLIAKGKTNKEITESMGRSFYAYRYDAETPDLNKSYEKGQKAFGIDLTEVTKMLEKKGYIYKTDNPDQYELGEKGKIATRIKGVNEIFITEAITSGAFDKLTPAELAGTVAAIVIPPKEDDKQPFTTSNKTMNLVLNNLKEKGKSLRADEKNANIENYSKAPTINKKIADAIEIWAEPALAADKDYQNWQSTVQLAQKNNAINCEGELFKIANGTANTLKQISLATEIINPSLSEKAMLACKSILKTPVQSESILYDNKLD